MGRETFKSTRCSYLFAFACAVAIAPAAGAQGFISAGQTVSGRLDTSDYLRDDGTFYDDWFYEGRAGETITVTQSSSDFDSWLLLGRVVGGDFQLEEFNDDGAGDNDSRITYTLPADGRYVIRANVVGRGRTGSYTLRVDRAGSPVTSSRRSGNRMLVAGQTFAGELDSSDPVWTDDTHYELWRYSGRAGERVMIVMRSPSFNSYMQYGHLDGDDFRYVSGSTSRTVRGQQETVLEATLPSTGEYGIRANSHGRRTGPYTISVASSIAPTSPTTRSAGSAGARPGFVGINQTVFGQLDSSDSTMTDGTYYDFWRFSGQGGQRVRITMRSNDFDSYMTIGSFAADTYEYIKGDNDGAGGNDSMIEFTLPASGEYGIRANSMGKAIGRYTITVQSY